MSLQADPVQPGEGAVSPFLCPHCRYNLSGLTLARCPECGTPLRIERDQPRGIVDVHFRLGLAGLIITAAVGIIRLLAALGASAEVLFFGTWTIIALAAIAWWCRAARTMLLRQYPDVRRAIVLLCLLLWLVVLTLGWLALHS